MRTNRNLGLNKQAKKIHNNSTVEDIAEELGFSFNSVESVRETFINQFKAHGYSVDADFSNKYLGSNKYVEINSNYIKKDGEHKLKNFVCFVHPNPKKEIAFGVGFSGTMTYYENEPGYIWIHGADNEAYLEGQGIQFRSRGSASVHHVDIDALKAIFNLLNKFCDNPTNESSINLGLNKQAKKKFDFDSSLDKTIESMKELHTIDEAVDFIKMYAKAKGFNNIYEGYAFSSFNDDLAGKVYIILDKEYQRVTLKIKTSSGPSISTLADYPTYIEVSFGHMFRRVDTPSNEDYIDYWNRTGNAYMTKHLPTSIIVWVFDEAKRVIKHNRQKVNESNLGLNKKAKKVFNNSVEDPLGEFNEEFLKSLVLSKIVYCITGDENKKELDDEGFGLQCDLDDGVAVDGKEKFGCRLYTINYKTTYIHSTIIVDQDTCEFLFIHVWYIDVSIPNWGYEDSKSIKIYPDEMPEDVREWIEDNIVIE